MRVFHDELFDVPLDELSLFLDRVPFSFQRVTGPLRVEDHISQQVSGPSNVLVEAVDHLASHFAGSEGVQVCSPVLHLLLQLHSASFLSSLEIQVFKEVGCAGGRFTLLTRSSVDSNSNRS